MRAYVFTDKALERHARRFVWLSIDTERPENEAFLEKYPVEAWPSLFIVDPRAETVLLRWLGSATVAQLSQLFDDGERAYRGKAKGLDAQLAEGDKLYGAGNVKQAADVLGKLVQQAPKSWPRRPRAIESWLAAVNALEQYQTCAEAAIRELPSIPRSVSSADVAGTGLSCALSAPDDAPWRKGAIAQLEPAAKDALGKPAIAMSADDRSGLYQALVAVRDDAGDQAGSKAVAEQWASFLEGEAAKAPTPDARAVFDPHRLNAYIALGQPERAVPMLQQSEKDLPADYNPSARLALAYRLSKQYPEALAASDRALAKVYGPRKFRVIAERANILAAMGRKDEAKKALTEGIAEAKKLPGGQGKGQANSLQRQLDKLEK